MPGWSTNMFVPSTQLLVVDRTPVVRFWVAAPNKGTSTKDQGFKVETMDSLAVTVAIVCSGNVKVEDAPKFLYNFGADNPTGNREDPQVVYASIVKGRSLAEVMDEIVWGKVQSELAAAFGAHRLEDIVGVGATFSKSEIIKLVQENVIKFFAVRGLTIDYVGFAADLTFEPEIQDSINRLYVANKNAEMFAPMSKMLPVRQAYANIQIKEGVAKATVEKWNGQLPNMPSFMLIPGSFFEKITNWLGGETPIPVAPVASAPVAPPATK
jgi:hypothetical protein